jgi:hypothetical protein
MAEGERGEGRSMARVVSVRVMKDGALERMGGEKGSESGSRIGGRG